MWKYGAPQTNIMKLKLDWKSRKCKERNRRFRLKVCQLDRWKGIAHNNSPDIPDPEDAVDRGRYHTKE
jgi:hypothetical protein